MGHVSSMKDIYIERDGEKKRKGLKEIGRDGEILRERHR